LARAFINANPQVDIVIQANDSNTAIQAVQQGSADVGMVSRALEPSELAALDKDKVQLYSLAEAEPIVIIGHILVPVDSLSLEQIRDIYRGAITNWGQISPVEAPIVIVSREEGADSRVTLERVVGGEGGIVPAPGIFLEKTTDKAVRDNVSSQPYAIGYVPRNAITAAPAPSIASQNWQIQDLALLEVKVLALDQIEPSPENATGGTYPLTRPLSLLTQESPGDLTASWLEFINSAAGQEIIERVGQSTTP
jgi:phosphate transport system substrate-binding protein